MIKSVLGLGIYQKKQRTFSAPCVILDFIYNSLGCRIVKSVNGPSLHGPTGQECWILLPEWHAVCSKMNTLIERPQSEPAVH